MTRGPTRSPTRRSGAGPEMSGCPCERSPGDDRRPGFRRRVPDRRGVRDRSRDRVPLARREAGAMRFRTAEEQDRLRREVAGSRHHNPGPVLTAEAVWVARHIWLTPEWSRLMAEGRTAHVKDPAGGIVAP